MALLDELDIKVAVLGLKGFDFETMNRLHEYYLISNPMNKNKLIWLTAQGLEREFEESMHPTLIPDFLQGARCVHPSKV